MKRYSPSRRIVMGLTGLLGMLVCIFAVQAAETVALTNDTLTIELDTRDGRITSWQPKVLDAATPPLHNFAQPAQNLFQLHGNIDGVLLSEVEQQAGGWQVVRQSTTGVHLELTDLAGRYSLHQSWGLDDQRPWQADYTVWLQATDAEPIEANLWLELGPGIGEIPAQGLGIAQNLYSYTQGVAALEGNVARMDLTESGQVLTGNEPFDWIGLQSRYFAFVLAPANAKMPAWQLQTPETPEWHLTNPAFETVLRVDLPALSGSAGPLALRVFGGGKSYPILQQSEPELDALLFPDLWNWMRALTVGLMHVLNAIHSVIGNWGAAILLLAVFVRLLIHPVAKRAMAAQKRFVALQEQIQPELKEIKHNYKGGEQSELILQLYERHNTSPFAGLKPLLIVLLQIPIFVALYHLLGQHFELREQSFLWIKSLAEPDQLFSLGIDLPFFGSNFNFLPALMALTTLASIKLSPAPAADEQSSSTQRLMMLLLTLGFFLLFYSFPSGMVLYWTAANILQLAHQRLSIFSLRTKGVKSA